MRAYLGACIILSVNPARQLRHVFSSESFLNNNGLHSVFILCCFSKISHYFCISDKTKEIPKENIGYDKLFKVRPVVEQLQKLPKILELWSPHLYQWIANFNEIKGRSKTVHAAETSQMGLEGVVVLWFRLTWQTILIVIHPILGQETHKFVQKLAFFLTSFKNWLSPWEGLVSGFTQIQHTPPWKHFSTWKSTVFFVQVHVKRILWASIHRLKMLQPKWPTDHIEFFKIRMRNS